MGIFSDLYGRLIRRFRKKSDSKPPIRRTQSLPREHKDRPTIVLRARANTTEVTIERRRVTSRNDSRPHSQLKSQRSLEKSSELAQTESSRKREKTMTRTDSSNSATSIVVTRSEPKKSVPSGSILAPSYRNRATSLRQNNVITISI